MDENKGKSIYDISRKEIFGKQFVAGFAHGLGGFMVTLLSWAIIYLIIVYLLLPQLQGTINQLNDILKLIPKTGGTTQSGKDGAGGTQITIPENLLKQIQQGNR